MARLSFTFGEVSPASSIGKVKAVSVLKLPRTQLVSTLTGNVTTFPVLKSSRTLETSTQSS
jgi:hypothetical protein